MEVQSDTTNKSGAPDYEFKSLVNALVFAAEKHKFQTRKDEAKTPYINHPIAVLSVLAVEAGITDIVTLQAALLHDTVEDTGTTFEELAGTFGRDVANVVMEVTDDKSLPKQERKELQVTSASSKSARAAMVKVADKICNLRDLVASPPSGWTVERKLEYFDWSAKVVSALPAVPYGLTQCFEASMRLKGTISPW